MEGCACWEIDSEEVISSWQADRLYIIRMTNKNLNSVRKEGDWQSWTLYQLHISGQQQRKLWSRNNTSTLTYQRCPMQIRVDSHLHSSHGAEQISNMKFCPLYMIKIYRNRQVFVGKHWWGCQTSIAYLTFHWKVFS